MRANAARALSAARRPAGGGRRAAVRPRRRPRRRRPAQRGAGPAPAPPGRASAALRRLLADPNPRVRLLAAGSLLAADPADAAATAAVASALGDPAPRLRRAALELVGSLGGRGRCPAGELRRREAEEVDPALSDLLAGLIARLDAAGREDAAMP